jgi:hypothetical protein
MSTSKHPLSGHEPDPLPVDDAECDPGIGASRGADRAGGLTGQSEDPDAIAGDNTVEGDVSQDVDRTGAIDPRQRGRTNA